MAQASNNERELASAPIGKLMVRLALPAVLAQFINVLYNVVDRIYIGHIPGTGALALTGVGVTMPIILLISAFAAFAGMGGAPLASIQLGAGNRERAERILSNSFSMLLILSVVLTIFFRAFSRPLLYAFGASDNIIDYGLSYINLYVLGTVFVQLALGLNTFISAQGHATTAMLSVLIGAVTNIVLDPILIFVFNMGVPGAAVATVISQACSAAWALRFLTSKKSSIRIRLSYMKLQPKIALSILGLGVAPFIMQSTESLVTITLNSGLQTYGGDLYVGSMTVMQSVMQSIMMPMQGISQGVQPILSYNYGAGNYQRVRDTFKLLFKVTVALTVICCLVVVLFPGMFGRIFTSDAELIALVSRVMPIFFAGIWMFGCQLSCQCLFMGLGQAKISLFLALLRKVILLVPLAILLPMATGSVISIFVAEPISDIAASATSLLLFFLNYKRLLPVTEQEKQMAAARTAKKK